MKGSRWISTEVTDLPLLSATPVGHACFFFLNKNVKVLLQSLILSHLWASREVESCWDSNQQAVSLSWHYQLCEMHCVTTASLLLKQDRIFLFNKAYFIQTWFATVQPAGGERRSLFLFYSLPFRTSHFLLHRLLPSHKFHCKLCVCVLSRVFFLKFILKCNWLSPLHVTAGS